jgi:hypothetical protein
MNCVTCNQTLPEESKLNCCTACVERDRLFRQQAQSVEGLASAFPTLSERAEALGREIAQRRMQIVLDKILGKQS